jgi:hypothetical protein
MSKTFDDSYPGEITDDQIKKQVVQESITEKKYEFPTEIVELPSKGLGYPKENLLSSGQVEMKYMTAKEEDILTSVNLIRKGTVLDKLFQSLIVSPINYNDLLIGDKNAIMVASRILGYGSDYQYNVTCPDCGQKIRSELNLSELNNTEFDEDVLSLLGTDGYLEWELPASKRKITFIIPTHQVEEKVRREMNAKQKINKGDINPEITTRFKHMILSVDGNDDKKYVYNFIDNEFLSRDSLAFRSHLKKIQPDIDFEVNVTCSGCDFSGGSPLTIDAGFFWPESV